MDIKTALDTAKQYLTPITPTPLLDAEVLLASLLKVSRTFLYTHPEKIIPETVATCFATQIAQRAQHYPVAYLTGKRDFFSLELDVSPAVLIPRAETEHLIEIALSLLQKKQAHILELGTGSGAIALALAHENPQWELVAGDKSLEALIQAKNNAHKLNITNVTWVASDWFKALSPYPFDLIVSNPPYLSETDPYLTQGDLPHEPQQALISGADGLDALRHIIQESPHHLKKQGWLLLEHGFDQEKAVTHLLRQAGFTHIQCWKDYAGHARISGGTLK